MIARLEGVLCELAPTRVVIDVSGVGYEVHIPLSTFGELPDRGKTVSLHIYTHARDGAIQLFGFASRDERAAFDLLLRASRVGPRLAQTILSGISTAELFAAIRGGQVAVLRSVPGVGTKMAERMLVELRDRADELGALLAQRHGDEPSDVDRSGLGDDVREQTLSALLNLGYPRAHAERVIETAAAETDSDLTVESLVRATLKRLGR